MRTSIACSNGPCPGAAEGHEAVSSSGQPGRKALRRALLARRRVLPDPWRREADAAIAQNLRGWLAGRQPGVLAAWWPLAGEPDLRACFDRLSTEGWVVVLPRVVAPDAPLEFGRWRPGIAMAEGRHRTWAPEPFEPLKPSLLLAPCVGFDVRGWRLGYGGGYYDRTLAALEVEAAGVAYDFCETVLDPEPHDRPLAAIITESRLLRCG